MCDHQGEMAIKVSPPHLFGDFQPMAYATQLLISNSPAGTDCISVKKK
jgi:hypothetical protein